jgi:hypothetical protein
VSVPLFNIRPQPVFDLCLLVEMGYVLVGLAVISFGISGLTLLNLATILHIVNVLMNTGGKIMKSKLLAIALLAGGTLFGQVSLGIRIGPPPPPRVVRVQPPAPGPGWVRVQGYWYPVNGRYVWHEGYWSRPPYEGAYWIAPGYREGYFVDGHWDGPRGRLEHRHDWDRERDRRDYRRYEEHHEDHDGR